MNPHNDNLEHFFRKGLSEEKDFLPEDSDWDVPSDAVWSGIEEQLPPVARKRKLSPFRILHWGAAASVLLLLFAYAAYHSQQKIDHLEEQVAFQSGQLKDLQAKNDFKTPIAPIVNNPGLAQISIENKVNTFLAKANEPLPENYSELVTAVFKDITLQRANHSDNNDSAQETARIPSESSHVESFDLMRIPMVTNNNITLASKDLQEIPAILAALALDSKAFSPIPESALPAKGHFAEIEPVKVDKKRPFYAGLFAGPSRWKTTVRKKYRDEKIVSGKVVEERGVEAGVKLGWQVNDHLALETGLNYVQNTKKVDYQMSFQFDPEKERPNSNGTLQATYDGKMNTDFGNVAVAFDVSRNPETELLPGETFDVNMDNEIKTSLLQIPLTARYGLQKGKFNLSLSAGMLLSFLQDQYINLPEKRAAHDLRLLEEHPRMDGGKPSLNKVHCSVQTGVQLAYRPNTTLEFYMAPTYTKGLTPVAENEEVSTTVDQLALMAGVNVRF